MVKQEEENEFSYTLRIHESEYRGYVDFSYGPHALRKGKPFTYEEVAEKAERIMSQPGPLAKYVNERVSHIVNAGSLGERRANEKAIGYIISLLDEGISGDEILAMARVTQKHDSSYAPEVNIFHDIFDGELRYIHVQLDELRDIISENSLNQILLMYPPFKDDGLRSMSIIGW